MAKIKGIIFDWAGTTVDFGCFAPVNVFINIFKEAGIAVTIAEAREPMGMLKRDHIQAMLEMPKIQQLWQGEYGREHNELDIDELYQQFEQQLLQNLATFTDPIPHVVDTVAKLREEGYLIGSTTGYTQDMMDIVSFHAKQKGYAPDILVTANDVDGYGRPYPYMIFENIRRLKLTSVSQVVKVGDTASDIQEAVNSGVIAIGVIEGSSMIGLNEDEWQNLSHDQRKQYSIEAEQKFKAHGADYVIQNISELPLLLQQLNN
ncbi:phosphonoacetaldehyde hydrolase [Staphylococcus arlettae]|uniref:phosphonoacetaldehyde hydrolase n=1 Tax=Staphylococcus TaxID=1279 RepID=UPI00124E0DA8|nr:MULTISPECIES: phosphonoacetaldehyde hydrolase [Staphylococcus]KAB2478812.1 phosphonoacetaldehyde hydrolase [Staphylococcus sp. CH99b_3]MCD8839499.1 phosphonoacetaldehyde hydrolase [Staphylococcus arlettae]MCD8867008.1 phosphonoacetaldehyde hydrolase [Staphylococcus arlettae]MCD8907705.1 phosphonoacetaldehyde hydrolase [Staphylococcus arlettae]MEB7421335.1 phosphonoacetaldehyde hydrolase [Staphylococcus arlettae]